MIRISVIISAYCRFEQLQDAVASVRPQLSEGDELIVVDNGFSEHEHVRLAAIFSRLGVRFLHEPLAGMSHARNHGAGAACGDVLAFLDDDAVAPPQWLTRIRACFADGRYDCVGGSALFPPDLALPDWFPPAYSYVFGETNFGPEAFDMDERTLPGGGNLAFRREAFFAAGMFPTDFGRTGTSLRAGEDIFICRQIVRRGGRVRYMPDITVAHRVSPARFTSDYMRRSAHAIGRDEARMRIATQGGLPCLIRGALKLGRMVFEMPRAAWRRWHGDRRAWAAHCIRVAMLRGYLGMAEPAPLSAKPTEARHAGPSAE